MILKIYNPFIIPSGSFIKFSLYRSDVTANKNVLLYMNKYLLIFVDQGFTLMLFDGMNGDIHLYMSSFRLDSFTILLAVHQLPGKITKGSVMHVKKRRECVRITFSEFDMA
jgi:hypothetical protein